MKLRGPGKPRSGKKVTNGLVAVSSAAVMAVYAAGYTRTRTAADLLEGQSAGRRPSPPQQFEQHPPAIVQTPPAQPPAAEVGSALPVTAPKKEEPALIASVKPQSAKEPEAKQQSAVPAEAPAPASATAPQPAAAPAPQPAVQPAAPDPYKAIIAAAAPPWKDGKYEGWGTCRHGDLQVTVIVEAGKISSADITQCLTRYSCDIIDKLPGQVIQRQSADVSYVSGATQSTDAYYWAVISALGKAK